MKKLLAVISLAFVVGVGVHAQQSKTVIETLKQGKPKAAQTEQANSTEPLLAFRVYDKGIIFSMQGSQIRLANGMMVSVALNSPTLSRLK